MKRYGLLQKQSSAAVPVDGPTYGIGGDGKTEIETGMAIADTSIGIVSTVCIAILGYRITCFFGSKKVKGGPKALFDQAVPVGFDMSSQLSSASHLPR